MQLTPDLMGEEIETVAARFREQDRQELRAEHVRLTTAVAELKATARQARNAYEQVRREKIVGGVCFLTGLMLLPLLAQLTLIWR